MFEYPGNPPIATGDRTASAHLAWEEKAVDYMDRLSRLLEVLFFGGESLVMGYPRATGCTSYACTAEATAPPSMTVSLGLGFGFLKGVAFAGDGLDSVDLVAPSASEPDRIDVIGFNVLTQEYVVTTGASGDTTIPTALDPDTTYPPIFPIAYVYHRGGETSILDADASPFTEGYIVDMRPVIPA